MSGFLYQDFEQDYRSLYQQQRSKTVDLSNKEKLQQIKYTIKQIDQLSNGYLASQISNSQQYLAYGGTDLILKIYDIKQENIVKQISIGENIYVCQFTFDSKYLYVGCQNGYVLGYDVINSFKQIFKSQIHRNFVNNIRTILSRYLVTCSGDEVIIKTDIKLKKQIFKSIDHQSYFIPIDYNEKDDTIISAYDYFQIHLWDCKNRKIILIKEDSHDSKITQLQLIDDNKNLLSLDKSHNLYKWKIDLNILDLIKIQEFYDPDDIIMFYYLYQDQYLLLLCKTQLKILNQYDETIYTLDHKLGTTIQIFIIFFQGAFMEVIFRVYNQTVPDIFIQDPQKKSHQPCQIE